MTTLPATRSRLDPQSVAASGAIEPRRRRQSLSRSGWIGFGIVALLVVIAVLGPWLVTADPAKQSLTDRLQPPIGFGGSWDHPLGTDQLGRDILARIIYAARLSLFIGVVTTLATGAIGVTLGIAAGYFGGRIDRFVIYLLDVALALPALVIAVAVTAALGGGMTALFVTLIGTGWIGYARILRLQTRSLRNAEFTLAAWSIGAGRLRLLYRHLLPNLFGTIVVLGTQQVGGMMLYAAALSYLGLGLNANQITWGGLVADGQQLLLTAWWPATLPGLALVLTVVGFSLAGDALRDLIERPRS
ncbi:MAG: ABC transporter permease [Thermomicrobiales bacterium]|nr:ABC transporter permease [Thermomicrobiales bacterium]